MYDWRKMSDEQRREVLADRKRIGRPWHSPPHLRIDGPQSYLVSCSCFEHVPHIGYSAERMDDFAGRMLAVVEKYAERIAAWCVLPNHYHVVVQHVDLRTMLKGLGRLHGKTSFEWNGEEGRRGRQVWFSATDRMIRSEGHLWASINYVHNNPVKHKYVARWCDWMWSSAESYLQAVGREEARRIWMEFPVDRYGEGWDDQL